MKNIDFEFAMCACNLALIILLIININLTHSAVTSTEELAKVSANQEKVIQEQKSLIDEIDWRKYKKQLRREAIKAVEKDMRGEE